MMIAPDYHCLNVNAIILNFVKSRDHFEGSDENGGLVRLEIVEMKTGGLLPEDTKIRTLEVFE